MKAAFLHWHNSDMFATQWSAFCPILTEFLWDFMAEKFNGESFTPETEALDDTHAYYQANYAASMKLSHHLVSSMHRATLENCQTKFKTMVVVFKRIKRIKRVKQNFEQSGQWNGGLVFDDGTEDSYAHGGPLHMHFVAGVQLYTLHLLYIPDKHDLLDSSVQELTVLSQ